MVDSKATKKVKNAGQPSLSERLRGAREIFGEVWKQAMGKAGFILITFIVVMSIYAIVTMPPNFVNIWSFNIKYWEDNPAVVPPAWVSLFGEPVAPHMAKEFKEPVESSVYLRPVEYYGVKLMGYVQRYQLNYVLNDPAFPKDVLVRFVEVKAGNVTGRAGPVEPSVTVYVLVHRPDGHVILVNKPEPLKLSDLAARGVERLDAAVVGQQLSKLFNIPLEVAQSRALLLLFGEPQGNETVNPLTGTYTVEVIITYLARGVNPAVIQNAVENGELGVRDLKIIVKGSAYGRMGTDSYGRDLYLGLLYGFPVALLIGFFAAVSSVVIGLVAGIVSGYYGGIIDDIIQRTVDVLGNIPLLPVLVLLGVTLQELDVSPWTRLFVIIGFLVIFGWGGMAIIVRSMTLSIKSEPYIDAAKAIGASDRRIIFKHILPQIVPYAMANLVFSVPGAILVEAGLSVLGIRHGLPTWGSILADARDYIGAGGSYGVWWWILPPGILIGITSLAFVFLGLALETVVEPRLKRR
ncbi:putative oligopeptide/dipeptide ABC transporter, permease protein [Pyrodictium delaneyi]|nr:ABC transporter permease [Pyrodictium delaneyi]ALL01595.1 putative oligopeptide/dipeptide ABC transporter, permease protein [Pyrodictium delaneyi]